MWEKPSLIGGGALGANLAAGLRALFGASAYLTAALVFLASILLMRRFHRGGGKIDTMRIIATLSGFCALLLCASSLETLRLYSVVESAGNFGGGIKPGGAIGFAFANYLLHALGFTGATLFLIAGAMCGASLFGGFSWLSFFDKFGWGDFENHPHFCGRNKNAFRPTTRARRPSCARSDGKSRPQNCRKRFAPRPLNLLFPSSRRAARGKKNKIRFSKEGGGSANCRRFLFLHFRPM